MSPAPPTGVRGIEETAPVKSAGRRETRARLVSLQRAVFKLKAVARYELQLAIRGPYKLKSGVQGQELLL